MFIITSTFLMLFVVVSAATTTLLSVAQAGGVPAPMFIGTIVLLMIINTVFTAIRYRTIGGLMGGESDDSAEDSIVMKHARSSTNAVIYERLGRRK